MLLTKEWLFSNFPDIPKDKIGQCFKVAKTLENNITEEFLHNVCAQVIEGCWSPPKTRKEIIKGSALDFLLKFKFCPSITGSFASNSQKRRLLEQKAVVINGETPGPDDIITFPLEQLVFFPNGKNKTTIF